MMRRRSRAPLIRSNRAAQTSAARLLSRYCGDIEASARRADTGEACKIVAKIETEHGRVQSALTAEFDSCRRQGVEGRQDVAAMRKRIVLVLGLLAALPAGRRLARKAGALHRALPAGRRTDVIARIVQNRLSEALDRRSSREPRRRRRRGRHRGGREIGHPTVTPPVHAFLAHHQSAALQAQLDVERDFTR